MARAGTQRGSPGGGAQRRGETNLPHITWPVLRERYWEARTFEERLGLIHAARRAETGTQQPNHVEDAERLLTCISFLTEIGNEVTVTEHDPKLRWQARIALARYCIPDVLQEPIRTDRHDERIVRCWRAAAVCLTEFFAADKRHTNYDFEAEQRERVHKLLRARWDGCVQPDDEEDRKRAIFSREEAGLMNRRVILQALVNTQYYELLKSVWDAAPFLYEQLLRTMRDYVPSWDWDCDHEALGFFNPERTMGWSTLAFFQFLALNESTRRAFHDDRDAILASCGYAIGRIKQAEPIAQALLVLLAKFQCAMTELRTPVAPLPFPRLPTDQTTD